MGAARLGFVILVVGCAGSTSTSSFGRGGPDGGAVEPTDGSTLSTGGTGGTLSAGGAGGTSAIGTGGTSFAGAAGGASDADAAGAAGADAAGAAGAVEGGAPCDHGCERLGHRCVCEAECTSDDDCIPVVDHTACCCGERAVPLHVAAEERCLTTRGEPPPSECFPDRCDETCTDSCSLVDARCENTRCVSRHDCGADRVYDGAGCASRCITSADCVVIHPSGSCCGCASVAHVRDVAKHRCLVNAAEDLPVDCRPSAEECAFADCADCLGTEPPTAVCHPSGLCVLG